ncbi:Aspartic proteinase nepenthesin-1 [Morus notabilis]|uniref:Aspartic proteinase nepenthesin-1 n=1 Tax=Morus notabilis TaxID=981085 RepID=W9QRT3_9ROSA|nr:protein ASPARTIC PROTEASE IN GUARD CELL 1 [Morus notabilis]EXB52179.1 Aspartic proteinase nepenthesin-1 [Morus notabilis]
MALNPLLFSAAITILIFSSFSPTLCRDIPTNHHSTQLLDVSASLKLAQDVLSFNPQSLKPAIILDQDESLIPAIANHSQPFSLPLHSRDSLLNSNHKDYRSLVLSRLDRDSARVDSLNLKHQLALNGLKRSDLRPTEDQLLRPEDLSTPIVSGTSQGSGEFFARIGVGQPAKQFYMVIDTGSDVNWLQCQPCSDCYSQTDPIFDPSSSSSYSPLSCESSQCGALETSGCRSGRCLYQVAYGDGSYTVGDFVTETVSFGGSGGSVRNLALGCGHDNEGLFTGSAGLVGLGGGPLSLTSQIKATSFSYCLVDRDSSASSALEFNSASPSDSVFAQILKNGKTKTFYFVELTGMSVGGVTISFSPSQGSGEGGYIVDSGTAVTRLRTQIYEPLRDEFKRGTQDLPAANGVALFDTCYDLSSRTSVRVPTVSFLFAGGKAWHLPAKNYLIPVDNSGTFCFAFAPTTSSLSIVGNVQQQGTRVSYDLANSRVGFSPNKC